MSPNPAGSRKTHSTGDTNGSMDTRFGGSRSLCVCLEEGALRGR
jgi:hypothetical protein